ncbi:hypothetical protein RFI_05103 [Reticulomyxa filosa]|uniref:Uncharacterized protein n=1 Tax=Reticulomyxa filosa TaxID=46433 RepID=X6P1S3_RETFI|nr:hypothetical protein RFI_05103 [Reticulomyxa filosa]|eukprot:ETO32014.1 hypothetical protein RFI_05103 [Reticulomyxa filosa]
MKKYFVNAEVNDDDDEDGDKDNKVEHGCAKLSNEKLIEIKLDSWNSNTIDGTVRVKNYFKVVEQLYDLSIVLEKNKNKYLISVGFYFDVGKQTDNNNDNDLRNRSESLKYDPPIEIIQSQQSHNLRQWRQQVFFFVLFLLCNICLKLKNMYQLREEVFSSNEVQLPPFNRFRKWKPEQRVTATTKGKKANTALDNECRLTREKKRTLKFGKIENTINCKRYERRERNSIELDEKYIKVSMSNLDGSTFARKHVIKTVIDENDIPKYSIEIEQCDVMDT